jgi:UDP-N-acetylmuramate dehydrogenase
VHDRQALVLVNRGGASGKEILHLSQQIAQSVDTRFGIALEREVRVVTG